MICPGYLAPQFFLYTDQIPPLIYYSHLSALVVLIIGIISYFKNKSLATKILFALSIAFTLWTILDLVTWTNNNSNVIMFAWSLLPFAYSTIIVLCIYLFYVFVNRKDVSLRKKILFLVILLPAFLFTATSYNLKGFDINICGAAGFESSYVIYFKLILGIGAFIWLLLLAITRYRNVALEFKRQLIFFTAGIEFFLVSLFTAEFVASYLADNGIVNDFSFTQYGFFAMSFFIAILGYMIVKFHTFNIKLIATQALVWGVAILVGSQLFFIKIPINFVLTSITFVATIIFGYFLIKSVKVEIEQKEQLANLNENLKALIKQRESLVHLVTHKVKGSFTHSKYIFAGLLDGTFGPVSDEVKKRAEQGLESDNMGIETVDLVLNVANMQKGTVKYDMKPMNLREVVEKSMSEKKIVAETKGLVIQNNIQRGAYNILGDTFWIKEVINNLLENSIKYTKTGTISVNLEKQNKKILLSVKDTGVGITPEDKANLFTEGGRGKDSVKVNIDSTGYGLYSVKLIVDAHNGRVWSESDGAGKGSTFFIELPVA